MKLVTYQVEKKAKIGVISKDDQWVFPIAAAGMEYKSMLEMIRQMGESEKQMLFYISGQEPYSIKGAARLGEVKILSPIPVPDQDILCLGINYMDHAEESARFANKTFSGERAYAVYFSKRVNETVGDGDLISGHFDIVDSLDYEAEFAVIIGKDAKNVPADKVKDYIFGYTIMNDVSARNLQKRHNQWYLGKSLDGFAPMGPCIVTADALPYPPQVNIQSYVNGELRQNSNTSLLIFGIDHIVSELSQGMTLKSGTIISTGTPSGVGMGQTPPKFLKKGDVVECVIEGIGKLTNPIGE